MNRTSLNLTNATLLIRLYKINMDYACSVLTALNQRKRHRLEVIQNHCLRSARREVKSTCIPNDELRSRCNIENVEQRILALENNWWREATDNNNGIGNSHSTTRQIAAPKFLWKNSFPLNP